MGQALYQAAILTFEELGFMFPVENGDETEIGDESGVSVGVDFKGPFAGRIVVQVEDGVLPVIASNMLGEEPPLAEELMHDALGEIANVICGNALPTIAGKAEIFRLEPPQVLADGANGEAPAAKAHLSLEEGSANVLLYLH